MRSIEERLQTIEQEHTQLKKTIELQTIAIGALVNKATLERLNEKYDRIFEALIAHDRLTNDQLSELRQQQIEEDGKIVGLQTEMRQRFNEHTSVLNGHTSVLNEHTSILNEHTSILNEHTSVLNEHTNVLNEHTSVLNEHTSVLNQHTARFDRVDARLDKLETLLAQVLERLPKAP